VEAYRPLGGWNWGYVSRLFILFGMVFGVMDTWNVCAEMKEQGTIKRALFAEKLDPREEKKKGTESRSSEEIP
jgi:surfactin synthase thioesterase subunit